MQPAHTAPGKMYRKQTRLFCGNSSPDAEQHRHPTKENTQTRTDTGRGYRRRPWLVPIRDDWTACSYFGPEPFPGLLVHRRRTNNPADHKPASNANGSPFTQVGSNPKPRSEAAKAFCGFSLSGPRITRREEHATKQKYKDIRFREKTLLLIDLINSVADEYQKKGYVLTLRQMYYQLVARGYIENSQRSYKNIGKTISDGRTAGLIDWDVIIDRLRGIRGQEHAEDPALALRDLSNEYRRDKWQGQPNYVEVWVEKDALVDVVGRACSAIDTPYTSDRGYTSTTAIRDAAQRFIAHSDKEGRYIIYLGDHDPSGVDMTRDIRDRLKLFGADVEVRRIALTMEQIRKYNPPPAFAKAGDARTPKYIREHGAAAWELDALDPEVLHDLIQDEVVGLLDIPSYNANFDQEQKERQQLLNIAYNYNTIMQLFGEV